MSEFALVNCDVFTGDKVLTQHAVIVRGGVIVDVVPSDAVPPDVEPIDLEGKSVAPGFIDLQVNGGGDVLFNDDPSLEALIHIRDAHRRLGTTDILPTYITGPADGMAAAAEAVNAAVREIEGILGIHFEGPAINPERAGVHDKAFIRSGPSEELLSVFTAIRDACCFVTLAPETVGEGFIRSLVQRGVRVAAGHTSATRAQMRAAFDEGLSCGTHLWNAMTPLTSREPGAVGALLREDRVWVDIIADGHHVDFDTVAIAVRAKPRGRTFLVTDAMSPVGGTRGGYRLGPLDVSVIEGRCVTSDGVLAGSALDLASAVRNCIQRIGMPKHEALRMASLYPAQYLGIDDRRGWIRPGYPAHLAVFDNEINVSAVVFEGEFQKVA